jgi:hypothetical protein
MQWAAWASRGAVLLDFLECDRQVAQWRRRFEVAALESDRALRAEQLQALLARVQNTAVHIKDLAIGEPLPSVVARTSALDVDGAVRVRVAFASQQRRANGDACRAELASRCCQQLLAVRAMLATLGDGRREEGSDLILAICPTLLAMPLPEDFRLQTCARLLMATN